MNTNRSFDQAAEFKRVLHSGGVFLSVSTYESVRRSICGEMRDHWRDWLHARGVDTRHPGAQGVEEVRVELASLSARVEEVEVVRFPHAYTLHLELDRQEACIFSDTWSIREMHYQASLTDLREWVTHEFRDLDQDVEETNRFVFDIAYFDTM